MAKKKIYLEINRKEDTHVCLSKSVKYNTIRKFLIIIEPINIVHTEKPK